MQYMIMQDNKNNMDNMDDMDCSQDQNVPPTLPMNSNFLPKTELDYLLLGCLLEQSQQSTQPNPSQNSPSTQRAFSMYQKQFENHKKKVITQTGFRNQPITTTTNSINNSNSSNTFAMPYPHQQNTTSGQSNPGFSNQPFYNSQNQMNNISISNNNMNGNNITTSKMFSNSGNNNNLFQPNVMNNNSKYRGSYQQNIPPNTNIMLDYSDEQDSDELDKSGLQKDKKKPKRPNKIKPQGCEWCNCKTSPVWRGGPSGKGSLCNACGLQYMKGFTKERAKETLRKSRGDWNINSQL